ncbi:MAG TPA: PKD domain-containing protein, partial [Bacteroidia bacterium]
AGVGIYKLLIHPTSPNIIFAATTAGIYRSVNSGASWTNVNAGNFNDIEFKPGNLNVLYAVQGWLNNGKFWRSTSGGASGTWVNITNGLPAANNICRYEIAVTAADTNYVYLVGAKSNTYDFYGFYRSTDGGSNFTLQSNTPNILSGPAGAQAWYNLCIAASASDKNKVLVGATNIWRTLDGGSSWTMNSDGSNSSAPFVHPDHHSLEFLPGSDSIYFSGNDGGVWKTSNNGSSWTTINTGLQISQMYKLGSYANDPYEILTGHQDEGFHLLQNNNWSLFAVITGDGMESIIDYTTDSIMYLSCNQGHLYKTLNHGTSFSHPVTIGGSGVNATANWVTPNVMHPTDHNTLLIGKAQVYRTNDKGLTWSQVGNVTGGSVNVIALAYAPSNPKYIYAAKSNRLFVSTDGNTFTDRTGLLPVNLAAITSIAVSATDSQKVWVTFSGYSAGTKVYYSPDAGVTWSNYSTGLPNLPANFIVYQKGSNDGLYVGMDVGVYFISNSIGSWIPFMTNLPNVDVEELEIHYANNKIRAATNGRSLWESDLATPTPSFTLNPSSVCEGSPVTFNDQSTNGPVSWSWSFPGGTPSSSTLQNPVVNYSAAGNYPVTLTVFNANGSSTITVNIVVHPLPPVPTITANVAVLTSSAASGNQWFLNGNPVNGATNQSYTVTQNGNYSVMVTDAFGCTSMSAIYPFTTVGINELSDGDIFTIAPNPSNGIFSLQTTGSGNWAIFIYNSSGELVFESGELPKEIDLSQKSPGLYFARLVSGNTVYNRKFEISAR